MTYPHDRATRLNLKQFSRDNVHLYTLHTSMSITLHISEYVRKNPILPLVVVFLTIAFDYLIYEVSYFIIRELFISNQRADNTAYRVVEIPLYNTFKVVTAVFLSFNQRIVDESVIAGRFMT